MKIYSKLKIRNATTDDIEALVELRKLLLSEGSGHYVSTSYEEEMAWQNSYRSWLTNNMNKNEKILVAVGVNDVNSEVVACAIGIIDERAPMKGCLNAKCGWVQTVVVNPTHRRQGFAENVMNYVFDWFQLNNVNKIVLQTTSGAKELYNKLGFKDSGEELLVREF